MMTITEIDYLNLKWADAKTDSLTGRHM